MKIFDILLDLIYPRIPKCINCGKDVGKSEVKKLCTECLKSIELVKEYCSLCGRFWENQESAICNRCEQENFYFEKARGAALYTGIIKDMIVDFKYNEKKDHADTLGQFLYYFYKEYYFDKKFDYLIPVPLHKSRLQKRSFNQAQLLAEILSDYSGIPFLSNLIKRVKNSPPLYNFSFLQRKKVVKDIFEINNKQQPELKDKNILIIDDIFTTGSTVNQMAQILKEKTLIKTVSVLTLATGKII